MDNIQNEIIKNTEIFRKKPSYPTYPLYHSGLYLEDLFYEKFINLNKKLSRYYLPIFWTTVYNDGIPNLQNYLNTLDNNLEYFTVCQHDDAVREKLPKNTLVYSAGGNNGNIPIPLVCSPIPNMFLEHKEKNYLASFVGSMTHPIREKLFTTYNKDCDFNFTMKHWTPKITKNDFDNFISKTKVSKFTLCPRGYGKTSFRLYETFQLNSVPVYISDHFWLPFTEDINWEEICVLIRPDEIKNLKDILLSINDTKYISMIEKGKMVWETFLEINKTCEKILNKI